MKNTKKYDKKEIKQIIILGIILILVIVFSIVADKILFKDEEYVTVNSTSSTVSSSDTSDSTSNSTSSTYTINGYTKSEWQNLEPYIDEDLYNAVMELFSNEDNFKDNPDIEIDISDYTETVLDSIENSDVEDDLTVFIDDYLNSTNN